MDDDGRGTLLLPWILARLCNGRVTEARNSRLALAALHWLVCREPDCPSNTRAARVAVDEPWTDAVSAHFGSIKAALEKRGERIEDFDAAIAAHALASGAVLVTANMARMTRVPGIVVEDWALPS